jgi:6-pyruvoyltetrahydropterin/6-carboxytetrahydropterin synthase
MPRFRITRTHEIHCGHRVYGHEGKCAHLHGHGYVFELTCEGDKLDELGRVIDFGVVKNGLCMWLEENWDHRFLLWGRDPALYNLMAIDRTVVAVPFNPTAENMAAHLVEMVGPEVLAGTGVRLVSVRVHETTKCSAVYDA